MLYRLSFIHFVSRQLPNTGGLSTDLFPVGSVPQKDNVRDRSPCVLQAVTWTACRDGLAVHSHWPTPPVYPLISDNLHLFFPVPTLLMLLFPMSAGCVILTQTWCSQELPGKIRLICFPRQRKSNSALEGDKELAEASQPFFIKPFPECQRCWTGPVNVPTHWHKGPVPSSLCFPSLSAPHLWEPLALGKKTSLSNSSWCLRQDLRLWGLPAFGIEHHSKPSRTFVWPQLRLELAAGNSFKSCHPSKPGESLQVQRTRSSLSVHLTCSVR